MNRSVKRRFYCPAMHSKNPRLKPPKPFVNLRASCRTELQEQFPDHVVNAWLGHSSRIAEKHYLQVTPDHWEKGASVRRGNAGDNIRANPQASTGFLMSQNAENLLPDGSRFPVILDLAPGASRRRNDDAGLHFHKIHQRLIVRR